MDIDLDRYYTPSSVAKEMLAEVLPLKPHICVDSTCGMGSLLDAACDVFGQIKCVGIDSDKNAIRSLRRKNPDWVLSVGDVLNRNSLKKTQAATIGDQFDLLVLNPPFSHNKRKYVDIEYGGKNLKGSVAMAYIMKSIDLFKPASGGVVIVPESLLYSETDAHARDVLSSNFEISLLGELKNCTFRGARAHSLAIRITPTEQSNQITPQFSIKESAVNVTIIRGGLPVHKMLPQKGGVSFIHTTELPKLANSTNTSHLEKTKPISRGTVRGWCVLIPRVGIPKNAYIRAMHIKSYAQLSDCVIALKCPNKMTAQQLEHRIKKYWDSFQKLFRGTGARYITLSRLTQWMATKRIYTDK